MKKTERLYRKLRTERLIALLTPASTEQCVAAYELFEPEGVVLEIALRSEHAIPGLEAIRARHPDALVLAGTVMTGEQAVQAVAAGASGVVSADTIPDVIDAAVASDVMCIPGGLSDVGKQLVQKAKGYGCSLEDLRERLPYQWIYKLFPAFAGTSSHLGLARAWRGPYKDLSVVYTGGVTLARLPELVRADPDGILCASELTSAIDSVERTRALVRRWKAALQPATARPAAAPATKPARVVTFGELMLRLSPPVGTRLAHSRSFDVHFGGAEANVAVSLAQLGLRSSFVSALPDNDLGHNAIGTLRSHGVDTSGIVQQGPRLGIYYLEHGAGPRASKVVYDRLPSAFSEAPPEAYDWERLLEGASWFHWTGITPALGASVARSLREALEVARSQGISVSADLNYRKKLWSRDEARRVMSELMPFVDLLVANEEDPSSVFGIEPPGTDLDAGKLDAAGYEQVAAELVKRFGISKVAITLRRSLSASVNGWSACLHDGERFHVGPSHQLSIVDRVGAGDAFAAGLIHALLGGRPDTDALRFAIAASCLKHSIAGDFNLVSAAEIESFAAGRTGGRVQR